MSRITKTLSDEYLTNIRHSFQEADKDDDGSLTSAELRNFLASIGWASPTLSDAENVLSQITKGKGDTVNFVRIMQTREIWSHGIASLQEGGGELPAPSPRGPISRSKSTASTPQPELPTITTTAAIAPTQAPEIAALKKALDAKEIELGSIKAKLDTALETIKAQSAQIDSLKIELVAVKADLEKEKAKPATIPTETPTPAETPNPVPEEPPKPYPESPKETPKETPKDTPRDKEKKKHKDKADKPRKTPREEAPASGTQTPRSTDEKEASPRKEEETEKSTTDESKAGEEDPVHAVVHLAHHLATAGSKTLHHEKEKDKDKHSAISKIDDSVASGSGGSDSPRRSKSKLDKKSLASAARRLSNAKTLMNAGKNSSKRRDSSSGGAASGALRRAPPRELSPEEINEYYAKYDVEIRKAQELVKHFNKRQRIKRLSSVVKVWTESDQSLALRQRNLALKEIFTTERTYAESLKKLVDVFISPLKKLKILDEDEIESMFSDIEVISDITSILLEKLEERLKQWPTVQRFGDIFRDSAPLMKLYYRFIRDFAKAQARLEELEAKYPDLKEFFHKQMEKVGGLSLMSFLIMPVQRLPRYEMLLRALLKLTDSTHVDFQNLTDALEAVVAVNKYINQRKKIEELKAQIPTLLSKKTQERMAKVSAEDEESLQQVRFLKISVEKARNLPPMDSNGLADPYVTIAFDGENMKTKTKKETLNPDWKEDFVLAILPSSPDAFTVAVIDHDRIGTNEMMGWIEFKLIDFVRTPEQSGWFTLMAPKGNTKKKEKKTNKATAAAQATKSDAIGDNPSVSSSPSLERRNGELYLTFNYVKEI